MKYFFVSDEIGSAIYFNHPKGQLLCFPVPTAQQVMSEKFNEVFTSIVCGDGESLIVFQKVRNTGLHLSKSMKISFIQLLVMKERQNLSFENNSELFMTY